MCPVSGNLQRASGGIGSLMVNRSTFEACRGCDPALLNAAIPCQVVSQPGNFYKPIMPKMKEPNLQSETSRSSLQGEGEGGEEEEDQDARRRLRGTWSAVEGLARFGGFVGSPNLHDTWGRGRSIKTEAAQNCLSC